MIILAIIIIVLIIFIFKYEYEVLHIYDLPITPIRDLPLNTGDIFITRCDYVTQLEPVHYLMFGLCNNIVTGGYGTHVGVIVNIGGTAYIYHAEFFPTYDYTISAYRWKAPVLTDYYDYIMKYCGEIIYYPIKTPLDINKTQDFIISYSDKIFSINQLTWANTIFKIPVEFNKNYTICTKLVSDYLQHMGILPETINTNQISPCDLAQILVNSKRFNSPVLILNSYINYKKNNKTVTKF